MDVRCSRCGTEYEFDDAKVVGAGVTVKCSSCGHVFKVAAPGAAPTSPPEAESDAEPSEEWIVRKGDGTTAKLKELTTLQKWIVEQRVTRLDEISRTGRSWKRLGDIQEFASFFQVVDAANIAAQQPTMQNVGAPILAPASPENDTILSPQPIATAPTTGEHNQFYETNASLSDLEDDDPVLAWKRRHRFRNAAIALLLLVVAAGVGAYFAFPAETKKIGEPLLAKLGVAWPQSDAERAHAKLLAEVVPILHEDDEDKVRALLLRLEQLEPEHTEDANHLAATSLAHSALAWQAEERGRLIALLGKSTRDVQTAQDDRASNEQRADELAARARRIAPQLGLAHVANAWVRALRGETSEMGADLDVASSASGSDPSVLAESRALSALSLTRQALVSSAPDARTRAKVALEPAAKASPTDRRLVYATTTIEVESILAAIAAAPDSSDAASTDATSASSRERLVVALTSLGTTDPNRRAALLLRRLEAAGNADSKAATGDDDGKTPKTDPKSDDSKSAAKDGKSKASRGDYDAVMKRANRARVRDRTRSALSLYGQAAKIRPDDARPHVGMGWSYLDLGKTTRAINAFRQATRRAPGLPVAHFGLAEALATAGQKAKAKAAYDTVLRLDPVGPDSAHARRALERLK